MERSSNINSFSRANCVVTSSQRLTPSCWLGNGNTCHRRSIHGAALNRLKP